MEENQDFARARLKRHKQAGDNLGAVRVLLRLQVPQLLLDARHLVLLGWFFAILLN